MFQAKLWKPLPSVMFGVLATLAGISCLFLPETLGQSLPDTIDHVEHSNRYGNKLFEHKLKAHLFQQF